MGIVKPVEIDNNVKSVTILYLIPKTSKMLVQTYRYVFKKLFNKIWDGKLILKSIFSSTLT